jgi:hypothetical protein
MAERLINSGTGAESASSLLERLATGEAIEVAGYELAGPLAAAMQSRSFDGGAPAGLPPLRWFDLVTSAGDPLPPATIATVARWAATGSRVTADAVVGDPFWSVQEITVAPRLVEATTRALLAD